MALAIPWARCFFSLLHKAFQHKELQRPCLQLTTAVRHSLGHPRSLAADLGLRTMQSGRALTTPPTSAMVCQAGGEKPDCSGMFRSVVQTELSAGRHEAALQWANKRQEGSPAFRSSWHCQAARFWSSATAAGMSPRQSGGAGWQRQTKNSPKNGSSPLGKSCVPSRTAAAARCPQGSQN